MDRGCDQGLDKPNPSPAPPTPSKEDDVCALARTKRHRRHASTSATPSSRKRRSSGTAATRQSSSPLGASDEDTSSPRSRSAKHRRAFSTSSPRRDRNGDRPRRKRSNSLSSGSERSNVQMPRQNPGQLGLAVAAQVGIVTTFAVVRELQRAQHAIKRVLSKESSELDERVLEESDEECWDSTDLARVVGPYGEVLGELSAAEAAAAGYECEVVVCQSGQEANQWKLELLRNAQHCIEISGNFCGGAVFQTALSIIEERMEVRPRLQVHIMSSPELLLSADKAKMAALRKRWPLRFHAMETTTLVRKVLGGAEDTGSRENHVKLVVVDEAYYVVGGTNFQEQMGSEGAEDAEVQWNSSLYERFVLTASRDMDTVGCSTELCRVLRQQYFRLFRNWWRDIASEYQYVAEEDLGQLSQAQLEHDLMSAVASGAIQKVPSYFKCDTAAAPEPTIVQRFTEHPSKRSAMVEVVSCFGRQMEQAQVALGGSGAMSPLSPRSPLRSPRSPHRSSPRGVRSPSLPTSPLREGDNGVTSPLASPLASPRGSFISPLTSPRGSMPSLCGTELTYNAVSNAYIQLICSAKSTIRVAHLNFNPAPEVMVALISAVNRGVDVELITMAADTNTTLSAHFYIWTNRLNYLALFTGRADLRTREEAVRVLMSDGDEEVCETGVEELSSDGDGRIRAAIRAIRKRGPWHRGGEERMKDGADSGKESRGMRKYLNFLRSKENDDDGDEAATSGACVDGEEVALAGMEGGDVHQEIDTGSQESVVVQSGGRRDDGAGQGEGSASVESGNGIASESTLLRQASAMLQSEAARQEKVGKKRGRVTVYEYAVKRTTFHKKVLIVDGAVAVLGSYNMSQKSHYGDDELVTVIRSEEVARDVGAVLDGDRERSAQVLPEHAIEYYFSWRSRLLANLQKGRVARLVA